VFTLYFEQIVEQQLMIMFIPNEHNGFKIDITACCMFYIQDIHDFRMEAMFGLSLPPVVCGRARVLSTSFVFVCA
jgi:hypothetical protein